MSASAAAYDKARGFDFIDYLLLAVSIACGLIFLFTVSLRPYPGSVVVKALSVSPLAVIAFRSLRNGDGLILGVSLLFSSAGDVFLGIDSDRLFVFGLGSFLISHILYIALFARNWPKPRKIGGGQKLLVALVIIYSATLSAWMYPSLGSLTVPVVVYMCAITVMGVSAILAGFQTRWIVAGALLFIISDSLIGVTKFKTAIDYSDYLIWATYYAGQLGIATGFLREKRRPGSRL